MSEQIEQWLQQHLSPPSQINMGLERVQQVAQQLHLKVSVPLITVAGTNGKGSVCHTLSAILTAAGFRVGCYTSPHLHTFGERIKINDTPAQDAAVLEALQAINSSGGKLTYFEFTTLAAVWLFNHAACDIIILEVGLGGRLDAVNIYDADVAVITNIGLDHTEYLGDTRDKIAYEKAGICRANTPVVIGDADPPAGLQAEVARRQAVPLYRGQAFSVQTGRYWHYKSRHHQLANLPSPALPGVHQQHNAAIALCALECLPANYWPGAGAIRQGLHAVNLPGRGQVLPGTPVTVLDVAHNAAAAVILEKQLFDMGYYDCTTAVFGMLARKDVESFVNILKPRIDHWHVACPDGGDSSADTLAAAVRATGAKATAHTSIAEASRAACVNSGDNGRIVVTGSFLTVADYQKNQTDE